MVIGIIKEDYRYNFKYILGGWFLFLIIDVLKKNVIGRGSFEFVVFYYVPWFLLWVVFTFPMLYVLRKSEGFGPTKRIIYLFFSGLLLGSVKIVATFFISFLSKVVAPGIGYSFKTDFIDRLGLFYFIESTIIVWVVIAVFYIIELSQRYKRKSVEAADLKTQLVNAQLQALKMQLQPHFLFNAHNTIAMLVRNKSYDQAVETISSLSELLRNSLNNQERNFVTVKEEMHFLNKYLAIEAIRFEDLLDIQIDVDKNLESCHIPNLILQPLVENAFKHGLNEHLGNSQLKISISGQEGKLHLTVFNTGPAIDQNKQHNNGSRIGIANTLDRLEKLYGANYSFEMKNVNEGVKVTMVIPANYR